MRPTRRSVARISVETLEDRVTPATFTVTTTADDNNGATNGVSLREAILSANASAGADTINFNIPGSGVRTITPTSALPSVTGPTTIDGYSQLGSSTNTLAVGNNAVLLIELNGASAGASSGLVFTAGSNTVRGLVINRFAFAGINLASGGGSRIEGNFLGTDPAGTVDLGNGDFGVFITSANNTIGGLSPSVRNVISGNGNQGIELVNSGAFGNVVEGNYIGTDRSGTLVIGNDLEGVKCRDGASNNRIGGTSAAARNVIVGNGGGGGISLYDNANGNQVQGNYLGIGATGMTAPGNLGAGVHILRAKNNTIGGTLLGAGNSIAGNSAGVFIDGAASSGNLIQGNLIGLDVGGTWDRGNTGAGVFVASGATGNVIAGNRLTNNGGSGVLIQSAANNTVGGSAEGARNVVSGNAANGIQLAGGSTNNLIQGNCVGTNATGTAALGNALTGVVIVDSSNNRVEGNVISGNGRRGVGVTSSSANGVTTGNVIRGNFIGTNAAGTGAIPNLGDGVSIGFAGFPGQNNTIGGPNVADRNVIAGNGGHGVQITTDSHDNLIQGNRIGTNADGTAALGNSFHGVLIGERAFDNTVENNLISGNAVGTLISTDATGNVVRGNLVGTNAAGTSAIPNSLGGVSIASGASDNTIGGPTVADRNVISGNTGFGVDLFAASQNLVQGNYVGTMVDGVTPLGNGFSGVAIESGSFANTVIGNRLQYNARSGVNIINASDNNSILDNLILANARSGISVAPADSTGNTFSGNRIVGNGWVPIDLQISSDVNQVTLNDLGDGDTGANNYQNFPFIAGVNTLGPDPFISGSLYSTPSTDFTLEFFAADSLSPSGHRQAQYVLGTLNVTTDATGRATFVFQYSGSLPGPIVTATATNRATGDTSELFNPSKPTDITLSNQSVQENAGANALVGNLTTTDPDLGDAHFYTLVSGTGATHNAQFAIAGNQLRAVNALNYEDGATRSVRIRTTDLHGLTYDEVFIITVLDVNERPTFTNLPAALTTDEDRPLDFTPTATDPDGPAQTLTYAITSGPLHGTLSGFDPQTGAVTYTPAPGFAGTDSFTYSVSDGHGGTDTGTVTVRVRNLVDLSGRVFDDRDNDGAYEPSDGDAGIGGVTVQLFDQSGTLLATQATAADGSYSFDANLAAGTYRVVAAQPVGFLDGRETAGTVGGAVDNGQDSNQITTIVVGDPDTTPDGAGYLFAEIRPSQVQGLVWSDFNNDGDVNFGEAAIAGVTIELTGVDDRGAAVNRTAVTDAGGIYSFIDLRPSDAAGYTIRELQPVGFVDGRDSLGLINGVAVGDASVNDRFSSLVLGSPGSLAENYNFGERPPTEGVTSGQTATIGYWQNKNGQNLILALNGGPGATQLGDWLATTFPNMYGANAGANDLTGKTNAQVAAFYKTLFTRTARSAAGGGPAKADAQVLATAFAVYVTNQSLAGTTATAYGFQVSDTGVGARTFDVGSNGAAFGAANNSHVGVLDLLLAVNGRSRNGLLFDLDGDDDANDPLETSCRTAANDVFSAINEAGDI